VNEVGQRKSCTPAAMRMRLSRSRRHDGLRVISFEVRNSEVDNLVAVKLLDPSSRDDRVAIARALGNLLDRIPVGWWQEVIRRTGARSLGESPRDYDRELFKARHLIEDFFAKLEQFRAIATRYDKPSAISSPSHRSDNDSPVNDIRVHAAVAEI